MEVSLPDLTTFHDLTLRLAEDPAARTRRGPRQPPTFDVDRVVRVRGPLLIPVTLDNTPQDDEIRPFLEAYSDRYTFCQLHFSSTIYPPHAEAGDLRLREVTLGFLLESEVGAEPPVAVSMTPDRFDRPVELSRAIKLNAALQVVDAGFELAKKTMTDEIYLEALNAFGSDPAWQLHHTESVPIRGSQRFLMIVRSPNARSRGTLTVSVQLEQKAMFRYNAFTKDGAPITFMLTG